MNYLDWLVLLGTMFTIVLIGVIKTRKQKNLDAYLGKHNTPWYAIGLSVMATQASAITFLSTPGQGFSDGMGFVQFYFGLPLALIVICVVFLPVYFKLKVYTAYEFLEERFDAKTRTFTAFLFLVQRGLAAGITIYAPSIILSTLMNWSLELTNIFIGILVIIYTVSGGTNAVTQTQKQQMFVILGGMATAFGFILHYLPENLGLFDALKFAGNFDKMEIINTRFDPSTRFTLWSGLTGGFFLALSYFGTDQSQVARYLNSTSLKESRMGLLFNGLFKIPMQFMILLTGVLVFVFYQFNKPPVFFNQIALEQVSSAKITELQEEYDNVFDEKKSINYKWVSKEKGSSEASLLLQRSKELHAQELAIREEVRSAIKEQNQEIETNDKDYVFLGFVIDYLPHGVVGLLLAVIFSAAMSSTASEINALASTTTIDIWKRYFQKELKPEEEVKTSKIITVIWGVVAILFSLVVSLFENLIQAVNILGSLFYGTILGIFLVAFFFKKLGGKETFLAGILAEVIIITIYFTTELSFLWFNFIGCVLVITIALLLRNIMKTGGPKNTDVKT